jgi:hypothetical protein
VQIRQTLRNVERMLDLNLSSAPASASSSVRHHAGGGPTKCVHDTTRHNTTRTHARTHALTHTHDLLLILVR